MGSLYCTVSGSSSIISVETEDSYGAITGSATIECVTTSLQIGDAITVDMGYSDEHSVVFQGFVKKIKLDKPTKLYTITANDMLVRASDYFLASNDPQAPLTYHNIKDRDLVNSLLGQCGLSTVSPQPSPSFTYGTNPDGAKFNLQSVADAIQTVCGITGRVCYAQGGSIYYLDRKPYVVGGDVADHTFFTGDHGNIWNIAYERSNDKIRNRIVVYGKSPLKASAVATTSPPDNISYIPVNQTAVIANELLDTQAICDATANVNLEIMNRLGRTWTLTVQGDSSIVARKIAHITESFTSTNDDVFIYRVSHRFSDAGYMCELTCVA